MKSADNPYDLYNSQSPDGLKRFSDVLLEKFKGKVLELYIGDQYETLTFEDYSQPQNCVIYGKLIEVLDRFVILECFYIDRDNKLQSNNMVYINTFQIRAMTELNNSGSLEDIFLGAKSSEKIKQLLKAK